MWVQLKKSGGRTNDELQTERLVARRLCREIEVELKQLQPSFAPSPATKSSGRRRLDADSSSEDDDDDDEEDDRRKRGGGEETKREREKGMRYDRLKVEFEKMKVRFERIDDALREKTREQATTKREPSASLFGELNGTLCHTTN
jgi:hypothetical protein